jgi:hypothetical protein
MYVNWWYEIVDGLSEWWMNWTSIRRRFAKSSSKIYERRKSAQSESHTDSRTSRTNGDSHHAKAPSRLVKTIPILIQILCFWTLSIALFFYLKYNVSETGFCLRVQVESTQLDPIDRYSPYLRRLDSVSVFSGTYSVGPNRYSWSLSPETGFCLRLQWNLLSWAQSIELVPISETGFCLLVQVEPVRSGQVDRADLYFLSCRSGDREIGPNWIDSTWKRRQNPVSETLYVLNRNNRMDDIQKHNNCILIGCSSWFLASLTLRPWRWRRYVTSKRRAASKLPCVTTQKTTLFIVKISDPT